MDNYFKKINTIALTALLSCGLWLIHINDAYAQEVMQKLPADTSIVTTHQATINGQTISYKAIVGTLPVFGKDGEPNAALQYTYYVKSDVENKDTRPLLISFNGGPGAASLWMHLGYAGPVRLKVSENGWPVQPYGVVNNQHSVLDVTDIVYVNPVNTGFSRILNDGKGEQFYGVSEDINYLAAWIDLFISQYGRWNSPKFIIGESYGTTRVAGLSGELQGSQNIHLNGVIMVSQCGLGMSSPSVLKLPYYTATAWYFKQLPPDLQNQQLTDILPEVETFTLEQYMPAVARGGSIGNEQKQAIAQQIARYSGLSQQFVLNHNLTVPTDAFWKELLREQGKTVGRLDSRYVGIDEANAGIEPDYSPEYSSWAHAFTPAMNGYIRDELEFNPNLEYYVGGHVGDWNRSNRRPVAASLRRAMQENPALHVLNQQGYYDGACDYFGAEYALWKMDARGILQDRIQYENYQSGHMMYIRKESLIEATDDLRQFILSSIPENGQPIKYEDVERVDLGSPS